MIPRLVALAVLGFLSDGVLGYVGPRISRAQPRLSVQRTSVTMDVADADKSPLKVIIAGGGIGGLVLANALKKHGISYDLYEKTREYRPFGGPIQVQSNALAALEAIDEDMCKEIMAAGTTTGNRVNGLKDGVTNKWYCQFDTGAPAQRRGLPLTRVVDRPDLQQILLKYMDTSKLHNGIEVVDFTEDEKGVEVTLSNGEKKRADVLVGADGIWSMVRARLHSDSPGKESAKYSGYTCYTGVCLARPQDVKEVAYKVYLAAGKYFVCSDVGKGRMQWYAMLGQGPGIRVPGSQREHLLKNYEGWSQEVLELLDATGEEDITQRDLYDRAPAVMRGWVSRHTAILGDAAHPMMPNLGQGGCQAVEDSYRLAKELSKAASGEEVPGALRMYEFMRLTRAGAVHGLARLASDVLFQSELLFKNQVVGSFVGFMMSMSMPVILDFLYQNVLDSNDWKFAQQRLNNLASYEEGQSGNLYKSVREAQRALKAREQALAGRT